MLIPLIEATFATPKALRIHLFLINSLDQPSHERDALSDFRERYNALTKF